MNYLGLARMWIFASVSTLMHETGRLNGMTIRIIRIGMMIVGGLNVLR